ncbi:9231_t:CDS:2, partial [Ambispora gerdemannii]
MVLFSVIKITIIFMLIIVKITNSAGKSIACDGVIQVRDQQDLDGLQNCPTFSGTIAIISTPLKSLIIPHIQNLRGTIDVQNNPSLAMIAVPHLKNANNFVLNENRALNIVDVPSMTQATTFSINGAPSLKSVNFPSRLGQIGNLELSNTGVKELNGVDAKEINSLRLTNNADLDNVSLTNTKSVGTISLSNNAKAGLHFDAQNLGELGEGEFKNLASTSFPSLTKVTSSLTFNENSMKSLEIPKLSEIGGTLQITSNGNLKSTAFSDLTHIGGTLFVLNNPQLANVDGFPNLAKVDAAVDITGSFDKMSMPALRDVRGGMNVQSSSNAFKCDTINGFKGNVVKGDDDNFTCVTGVMDPKPRISKVKDDN